MFRASRIIRRSFYLKYPFEIMNEEFLPPVDGGFVKKTASPEKFHRGRHADVLKARESNLSPVEVFTVGSNEFGQCGILKDVRKIPVDNSLTPNFAENQKKLAESGHEWNQQFKLVSAEEIPKRIEQFENAFEASSRKAKPFQFTNIAAGRQTSLAIGWRRGVQQGRRDWSVFASGLNHFNQLGKHVTRSAPRDLDGNVINDQFDERGYRMAAQHQLEEREIEEEVLAAFRKIDFSALGIPKIYRPSHISSGGGHSAVVFCHEDYDPFGDPQENISRVTQYPNLLVTFGNNDFGQCGHDCFESFQQIVPPQIIKNKSSEIIWNPVKEMCFQKPKLAERSEPKSTKRSFASKYHEFVFSTATHLFQTGYYSVFCGENHTIVFSKNVATRPELGWRVFSFGLNEAGQLGVGDLRDRFAPALVENLPPLTQISTRGNFNLGIDLSGNIWGWGDNTAAVFGSFTTDETVPKPVSLSLLVKNLDSKPVGIAAGTEAGIVLTSKGSVYTFGTGLLGHSGELTTQTSVLPVKIESQFFGKSKPVAVFAGDKTFGVLTETGELFNWGSARSNCIGVYQEASAKQKQPFPWKVTRGVGEKTMLDVCLGYDHSVALVVP